MATWSDVRRIARALPETVERGRDQRPTLAWHVKDKLLAWERPLRAAILLRLPQIGAPELRALLVEAWLERAPARLAQAYLDAKGTQGKKKPAAAKKKPAKKPA